MQVILVQRNISRHMVTMVLGRGKLTMVTFIVVIISSKFQ